MHSGVKKMLFEALVLFTARVNEINIFTAEQYGLKFWKFRSVPEIPQDFELIFWRSHNP